MFTNFSKTTLFSAVTAAILFSGCGGGGDSDTTAPLFSLSQDQVSVLEGTTDVVTLKAKDKNRVTYAIAGGADAALFTIDPESGQLALREALSFENAASADGDKIFEVIVKATDSAGNSATQPLHVRLVTSDTEAPVITSATTFEVPKGRTDIATIHAQDSSLPLSFTLINGNDAALFKIDNNGTLAFKNTPVYHPGGNNQYRITVKVSDAVDNSTEQNLTILVTDPKIVLTTGIPDEPGHPRNWQRQVIDAEHAIVSMPDDPLQWEDSIDIQSSLEHYRHKTFQAAKAHCENLNLGGYDDWRLPTPNELHQLVNHAYVGDPDKYVDDAFHYYNLTYYWTSVETDNDTARAVNIVLGTDEEIPKADDDGKNVRCVRGLLSEGEFVADPATRTVTDLSTGLIWDNSSDIGTDAQKFNHADAVAACQAKGMRLPTINELITLADYQNKKIRIQNPAGADALYFWSSTPALYENNKYRYFSFDKAPNEFGSKTLDAQHEIYIRCVKSKD